MITAVETTPGRVTENRKLLDLIEQHEANRGGQAETVVGDHKYWTQDNYVACQERGINTHLGDASKARIITTPRGSFKRYEKQAALDVARKQAHSRAARRDRKRRQQLMEQSFADAANNHHFKRSRWRRLWRQQIQDYLIAVIQNVRILLAHHNPKRSAVAALILPATLVKSLLTLVHHSTDLRDAKPTTLLRPQIVTLS